MPQLTSWSLREPTAWYLSARRVLQRSAECNGDYMESTISAHTPLHNIRINSNLVCYVRNQTVAIWRRSTQSGTMIEPHGPMSFHSWTCKTNIELLLTEKYLVTAVAECDQDNRYTGQISVKIYSTNTLEIMWEVRSEKLASQPSVQLLSVDDSGTVLLSMWDRDLSRMNDEEALDEDYREVSYFIISVNCPVFQLVEIVSNSIIHQSKIYMIHRTIYKITTERTNRFFGSSISVCCMRRNLHSDSSKYSLLMSKQVFSLPVDFGLVGLDFNQVSFWFYDQLQFQLSNVLTPKKIDFKLDLRCKTSFSVTNSIPNILTLSHYDQIKNSAQIHKISSSSDDILVATKFNLQNVPSDGVTVYPHDSAIVLQSEDRTALKVIDYLQPFLQ
jgi:hypothetical protein